MLRFLNHDIVNGTAEEKEMVKLKKDCVFVLGNRKRIRFWEDNWSGRGPLSLLFPDLYSIAGPKGAMAADLWERDGETRTWNPLLLRPLNDREIDSVQNFLQVLSCKSIIPLIKDKIFCIGDGVGQYSVKAYFNMFEGASIVSVPVSMLWNPCFCRGGLVGKGLDFYSAKKKEVSIWLVFAHFVQMRKKTWNTF